MIDKLRRIIYKFEIPFYIRAHVSLTSITPAFASEYEE